MKKEVETRNEKFNLSDKRNKSTLTKFNINMDSDIGYDIKSNNEALKNKFLKNSISILCSEIPEMKSVLSDRLQEMGIEISSRPESEKAGIIY